MNCPYCDFRDSRGAIHRHLAEKHGALVIIRVDEASGRRFYGITCPVCRAPYEHQVKPRNVDPSFLQEFDREIKLVAFDMLLYHMQGEHAENAGGQIQTTKE
jgi:hypothetical protein